MAPLNWQFACAEIISLLYHLDSVPAPPSKNQPLVSWPLSSKDQQHALSYEQESDIVDMLAFLSSVKHDPNSITALCVHQDVSQGCLNVLIAMNAATSERGDAFLQKVKAGFERIFDVLAQATTGSPEGNNKVFDAIVDMCQNRILERLRLKKQKCRTPRQHTAVVLLLQLTARLLSEWQDYNEQAEMVVRLIRKWGQGKTLPQLARVVDQIHQLSQLENLSKRIHSISDRDLDPSSKTNLINIICKVARYRVCARALHRLATKSPLVRNSKVKLVQLPQCAFGNVQHNGAEKKPCLASTLSRVGISKKRQPQVFDTISRRVQTQTKDECAGFDRQAMKTLSKAKIHAEIQLVYHCEVQELKPPPRVICSNKDACFLCNEFLRMHAKFYTPRQHGRLYPGWRLPVFPKPRQYERQFVALLQGLASKKVAELCQGNKGRRPDPAESTLGTLHGLESTWVPGQIVSSSDRKHVAMQSQTTVQLPQDSGLCEPMPVKDVDTPRCSDILDETRHTESGLSKAPGIPRLLQQPGCSSPGPVPSTSSSIPGPSRPQRSSTMLYRGVVHSSSIKGNSQPNIYEAWPLTFHITSNILRRRSPSLRRYWSIHWNGLDKRRLKLSGQAKLV